MHKTKLTNVSRSGPRKSGLSKGTAAAKQEQIIAFPPPAADGDSIAMHMREIIRELGEDPEREGLLETPKRVVNAYQDWFSGYEIDPADYLRRTFEEVGGYDEMVVLRDISFESHCEHHLAGIIGRAHVGYLPTNKVVGISKLARVVEAYARRLQVQEKMTAPPVGGR